MHGTMSEFQPGGKESWSIYTERLGHYFVANKVTEAEQKRTILYFPCADLYDVQADQELVSFPDRIFRARPPEKGSGELPIPFSFKCAGILVHCSFLI